MNELITACLEQKNVASLADFPRELMTDLESDVTKWIMKYIEKFRMIPSVEQVTKKFPAFVPLRATEPPPLEFLFQEELERKMLQAALSEINQAEIAIRERKEFPAEQIRKMLAIAMHGTGVHRFSTFDRHLYLREHGLKLGFALIDRVTGGLAPGDYCLIVGRLGTRKTTVAQWITKKWWEEGRRILFVSTEMLASDIFSRLDGMTSKFNPLILRTGTPEEIETLLKRAAGRAAKGKGEVIVPSRRLMTPLQISSYAMNVGADAIIVDGVYLLQTDRRGATSKWERVAEVSNGVKQMAMELERPVLATSQIKRVGDKAELDVEDIAYSDSLGQDADFVITIKPQLLETDRAELSLIKNRFGPNIATAVRFDFDKMQLVDDSMASEEAEERSDGRLW